MEFKYANPNDKIVESSNLHPMDFLVLRNCENWIQKQILCIIF